MPPRAVAVPLRSQNIPGRGGRCGCGGQSLGMLVGNVCSS